MKWLEKDVDCALELNRSSPARVLVARKGDRERE
jgi:hypothetical protein